LIGAVRLVTLKKTPHFAMIANEFEHERLWRILEDQSFMQT